MFLSSLTEVSMKNTSQQQQQSEVSKVNQKSDSTLR